MAAAADPRGFMSSPLPAPSRRTRATPLIVHRCLSRNHDSGSAIGNVLSSIAPAFLSAPASFARPASRCAGRFPGGTRATPSIALRGRSHNAPPAVAETPLLFRGKPRPPRTAGANHRDPGFAQQCVVVEVHFSSVPFHLPQMPRQNGRRSLLQRLVLVHFKMQLRNRWGETKLPSQRFVAGKENVLCCDPESSSSLRSSVASSISGLNAHSANASCLGSWPRSCKGWCRSFESFASTRLSFSARCTGFE